MTKEIPLTKGKIAIVDAEDFEWLNKYSWYYEDNGYACRRKTFGHYDSAKVYMHREILGYVPPVKVADHINGNRLDNRRDNLRKVTQSKNAINSPPRKGTSKYKGVHWNKGYGRWVAKIEKEGAYYYLGQFDCEINAAIAYNKKARELFGEYAYLNKVPRSYIDKTKERPTRNTSKYLGVSYTKTTGRYRSVVRRKGEKPVHIGYFDNERAAALARDIWMSDKEDMNFKESVVAYG